jgi:hypothetical protein
LSLPSGAFPPDADAAALINLGCLVLLLRGEGNLNFLGTAQEQLGFVGGAA